MAKMEKASEQTQGLINRIMEETGLINWVNVIALAVPKQKQLVRVSKANATIEYISKQEGSVVIYVYEEAFDRLNDISRELVMRDAINTIEYDGDKDKITIAAPQITVTMGGRAKYGDSLLNAYEAGVLAIQQLEEEKKEAKEAKKGGRKRKEEE